MEDAGESRVEPRTEGRIGTEKLLAARGSLHDVEGDEDAGVQSWAGSQKSAHGTREAWCLAASLMVHVLAFTVVGSCVWNVPKAVPQPLVLTTLSVRLGPLEDLPGVASAELGGKDAGKSPDGGKSPEPQEVKPDADAVDSSKKPDGGLPSGGIPVASPEVSKPREAVVPPDSRESAPPEASKGAETPSQTKGGQSEASDRTFADEVSWPNFEHLGQGSFSFAMSFNETGAVASLRIISATYQDEALAALRRLLMSARAPKAGSVMLEMDVAGDSGEGGPPLVSPSPVVGGNVNR